MAADPIPTATPALTSLARRSSSRFSESLITSSLTLCWFVPMQNVGNWEGRLNAPPIETLLPARGGAGICFGPACPCLAVGLGGNRQDPRPDVEGPALAPA